MSINNKKCNNYRDNFSTVKALIIVYNNQRVKDAEKSPSVVISHSNRYCSEVYYSNKTLAQTVFMSSSA